MRCKNCGHEANLHDLDEGFCSGVIYEQCDPNKPASPTIPMSKPGSPTIPMRCDCPLYESEVEIAPFGGHSYRKERRIQIIESLMEMESRFLDQQGRSTSKRMRKLEQVLSRLHWGSSGDVPEGQEDEYTELDEDCDQGESALHGRQSRTLQFKIADKGGVSVYGLGRFPVTLYYDQWVRLLGSARELRMFLEAARAAGKLKLKE